MKTPMKIEDILESPHYSSIINLTMSFQEKEDGLRVMHYRWALIKDHDRITEPTFVKNMNDFFSSQYSQEQINNIMKESQKDIEKLPNEIKNIFISKKNTDLNIRKDMENHNLNYFYKTGEIKKDCIKGKYANNNLTNFLKKLVTKYEILNKNKDNDGIERYTISDFNKIKSINERLFIKRCLEKFSDEEISELSVCCRAIQIGLEMEFEKV